MDTLFNRVDLIHIANSSRFFLRHYARGFYPCSPMTNTRPVNRLFFPLVNPEGDENFISDAKHCFPLNPGRMLFVPAYYPTAWSLSENFEFLSIHFNLELFPDVDLFSGCSGMLELDAAAELPQLLALMASDRNDWRMALKAAGLVHQIAGSLLTEFPEEDFLLPTRLRKYQALTDYLSANASASVSVPELAERMNMSREHFTRNFSKATGMTPKQLIDRFVFRKSMELLLQGMSVKETAVCLKFSTEFVFSRFFRHHAGIPPHVWQTEISREMK